MRLSAILKIAISPALDYFLKICVEQRKYYCFRSQRNLEVEISLGITQKQLITEKERLEEGK